MHVAHILFYAEADGYNQDSEETDIISSPNPTGKANGKRFDTPALSSKESTSMGRQEAERGGKKFSVVRSDAVSER
ncbi:hypothetical protein SAMN05216404_10995 [Nitrosospira multiformis]|uniref:Uncharacterized protein n=1 Tax=Nitrosospira multiformis TaxID=1231 RepID=A0A1H8KX32_9PROT|nr:hypothetical protein SAMN05216404_10995 [Nitrosospira multiformis]